MSTLTLLYCFIDIENEKAPNKRKFIQFSEHSIIKFYICSNVHLLIYYMCMISIRCKLFLLCDKLEPAPITAVIHLNATKK